MLEAKPTPRTYSQFLNRDTAGGQVVDNLDYSIVPFCAKQKSESQDYMPQHKSAIKRVRQNERRRLRNRLHKSRIRTMIKRLKSTTDREEAEARLRDVKAYLDRLSTKGVVHRNTAANYKSKLEKHVNELG